MTQIDRFREKVLQRGANGIKGIGRTFRIYDDDGSKNLSFEEFCEGIQDYGLDFDTDSARAVFDEFDRDGSGEISINEFLVGLRGNLNERRKQVVLKAFEKADKSNDGVFDANDMKKVYKVTEHPKYKNGEWDEARVFKEFLKSFEPDEDKRDGKVTEEEFLNYYAGVSANIDHDAYFCLMVQNSWKLN